MTRAPGGRVRRPGGAGGPARGRLGGAGARESIPSSRTSGPRSSTRSAPSTRAPSPTCSGGASRCFATPATRDSPPPKVSRRSWPPSSAWPAARRAPALLDYRNAVDRSRRWRERARRRHRDRDDAVDRSQPRVERQHGLRARARDIQAVTHVFAVRRRTPFVRRLRPAAHRARPPPPPAPPPRRRRRCARSPTAKSCTGRRGSPPAARSPRRRASGLSCPVNSSIHSRGGATRLLALGVRGRARGAVRQRLVGAQAPAPARSGSSTAAAARRTSPPPRSTGTR